jgi:mRNA interferase MazF
MRLVLCDQVKTLDITAREYEFIEKAPKEKIVEVLDILSNFLESEE